MVIWSNLIKICDLRKLPQYADYNQLTWLEIEIAAFSRAISGAYGSSPTSDSYPFCLVGRGCWAVVLLRFEQNAYCI